LAGDPLCWFFWGEAGLSTADVVRVLPKASRRLREDRLPNVQVVHAGATRTWPSEKGSLVAIPLLPVQAATPGVEGGRIVLPATLVSPVRPYPELSSDARNFDSGLPVKIRVRIDVRFFVNPNVGRLPPNCLSRFSVEDLDGDGHCSWFLRGETKWVVTEQHRDG
jgi:hypothetical protein